MSENSSDKRSILGVVLLLIGAFIILSNLNMIPFYIPHYIFRWPMILILIGVLLVVSRGRNSSGFILIAIGGVFLFRDIVPFSFHEIGGIWPVILILIGVGLLIHNRPTGRSEGGDEKKNEHDYIDEITIFGGTKKIINSQQFRGGKVSSIFGGSELILNNAVPVKGGAKVEVFTMFGGCVFAVPSDWTVRNEATVLLGGFDDKRNVSSQNISDPEKTLIIKGFVMFGGGEIKSYV